MFGNGLWIPGEALGWPSNDAPALLLKVADNTVNGRWCRVMSLWYLRGQDIVKIDKIIPSDEGRPAIIPGGRRFPDGRIVCEYRVGELLDFWEGIYVKEGEVRQNLPTIDLETKLHEQLQMEHDARNYRTAHST